MQVFADTFMAAGYTFRVESDLVPVGRYMASCLAPFEAEPPSGTTTVRTYRLSFKANRCLPGTMFPSPYVIRVDGDEVWSAESAAGVVEHTLWLISQDAIAHVTDRPAVHAAAAAHRGVGVIMPAPPEAGKTTLVAGLVHAGFSYLSDEMALVNPTTGWVEPFPRPLWIDRQSIALIPGLDERLAHELIAPGASSVHVRPDDIRPGAIGGPSPVGLVVAPRYEPGTKTALMPMGRAEMLRYLILNSPNADRLGATAPEMLACALSGAECYSLRVGDLASAVEVVKGLVESFNPRLPEPPKRLATSRPPTSPVAVIPPEAIDTAFRPAPRDAVVTTELDGEAVLYDVATQATHLLNRTATRLWSCFDGESSLDEIAADAALVYGQDQDMVLQSLVSMVRQLGWAGVIDGVSPEPKT